MKNERVYALLFSSVYPLYIKKAEAKGRTKEEVDAIIFWLTGYNKQTLQKQIDTKADFETFFAQGTINQSQCFKNYGCDLRV